MTTEYLYYLALEGNDDQPDDVCPECHREIPRWREFQAHYPAGERPTYSQMKTRLFDPFPGARTRAGIPWPYLNQVTIAGRRVACVWERDHLSARHRARELIEEGITK